jgi:hypothetical protein
MIPTDKDGSHIGFLVSTVILIEVSKVFVFLWAMHMIEIIVIPQSLEVSTDEQYIYFYFEHLFVLLNLQIDLIELSMATAFDCYLNKPPFTFILV